MLAARCADGGESAATPVAGDAGSGDVLAQPHGLPFGGRVVVEIVEADLTDEQGAPLRVHATLGSAKPVTLHGAGGYSRKGSCASCASHYSSFPRLRGPASVSSAKCWLNVAG